MSVSRNGGHIIPLLGLVCMTWSFFWQFLPLPGNDIQKAFIPEMVSDYQLVVAKRHVAGDLLPRMLSILSERMAAFFDVSLFSVFNMWKICWVCILGAGWYFMFFGMFKRRVLALWSSIVLSLNGWVFSAIGSPFLEGMACAVWATVFLTGPLAEGRRMLSLGIGGSLFMAAGMFGGRVITIPAGVVIFILMFRGGNHPKRTLALFWGVVAVVLMATGYLAGNGRVADIFSSGALRITAVLKLTLSPLLYAAPNPLDIFFPAATPFNNYVFFVGLLPLICSIAGMLESNSGSLWGYSGPAFKVFPFILWISFSLIRYVLPATYIDFLLAWAYFVPIFICINACRFLQVVMGQRKGDPNVVRRLRRRFIFAGASLLIYSLATVITLGKNYLLSSGGVFLAINQLSADVFALLGFHYLLAMLPLWRNSKTGDTILVGSFISLYLFDMYVAFVNFWST